MSILDRYISRQFIFNLATLFVVISGLYVLLDLIVNFDEFVKAAQRTEGQTLAQRAAETAWKIWDFYWPSMFQLYNYMAGLLPIGAAGFTLAALVRNRELVAMLAGGVSLHRVVAPLIVWTFAANLLLVANQELVIPRLATTLLEGHSKLNKTEHKRSIKLKFAPDGNGLLFCTPGFDPKTSKMEDVMILVRHRSAEGIFDRATARITASQAHWDPDKHGWELTNGNAVGDEPEQPPPEGIASGSDSAARTLSPEPLARQPRPVEFVPSDLEPQTILLREKQRFREFLSLAQISQLLDKPNLVDVRDLLRIRHSRFSVVAVNMLILLMGLRYFMPRTPGPLLVPSIRVAMLCVPAWAGSFLMHQISPHALPPAAIAWLPVALYLPIAFYMMESVET